MLYVFSGGGGERGGGVDPDSAPIFFKVGGGIRKGTQVIFRSALSAQGRLDGAGKTQSSVRRRASLCQYRGERGRGSH